MTIDADGAVPRPREDRVVVKPGSATYLIATLREGGVGTGRSFAWFGAAVAENQFRGLPGFRGAAFMVADDDRHSFEIAQWESEAALDDARRDERYNDQLKILRSHGVERHVVVSPDVRCAGDFPFERGDIVVLEIFRLPAHDLRLKPSGPGDFAGRGDTFALVSAGTEGGRAVVIEEGGRDLALVPDGPHDDAWRATMRVVDVVSGDPAAGGRRSVYRLLPATGAPSTANGQGAHG